MSITVKEVDKTYFPLYDQVSMNAYDSEPEIADEAQFVWHLEL